MLNEKIWRRYVLIECHLIWSMTLKFSKLTLKNRWEWWNLHNFYNQQRKPKIEHVKEIAIKTIAKGTKKAEFYSLGKQMTYVICLLDDILCDNIQHANVRMNVSILNNLFTVSRSLAHSLTSGWHRQNKIAFALSLLCLFVRSCVCVYYVYCVYLWVYCSSAFEWYKCLRRWRRRCHRQNT